MRSGDSRAMPSGGPGLMLVAGVILLVACAERNKSAEAPPKFTTTSLPCFIPRGTLLADEDTVVATGNFSGPTWCERTLELFLKEQRTVHVVSIIPLEYPASAGRPGADVTEDGTQELLVLHADRGPWPIAGDLTVTRVMCALRDSTALKIGPAHCGTTLGTQIVHWASDVAFWVPLTGYLKHPDHEPGTSQLLRVDRRAGQSK
ncbi:MAG: hypothetical protein JWP01_3019 [Myxococcales bacterium]|nr:hypothetical protein [Myxococcales bacterium]